MPTNAPKKERPHFDAFREEWFADIDRGNPSSLDRGRRFAAKLVSQWLGVTVEDEDFIVCDGSGDGGIDVAYLQRAESNSEAPDEDSLEGDTWYLVQSKLGESHDGASTILDEGNKLITTLQGSQVNLAENTRHLLDKLTAFLKKASSNDRMVAVFATATPLSSTSREALERVKIIGREKIFPNFDVQEVSLQVIWEALDDIEQPRLSAPISGQFVEQSSGLLVGTVSLLNLFEFLKEYQKQTGNLDQLYERNVRQFLGGRRKINKGIANTLSLEPEKFGLYNNGITLVVSGYSRTPSDSIVVMNDPYIVNGCQTTRTIWQVLDSKLNSGGTGSDADDTDWKERVGRGGVVAKIVRSEEAEIINITRYTNSQNAVREQDFIALHSGFQSWKVAMESDYSIFLEIQRGGTESRRAWEKQHPNEVRFEAYANAFDLMKVYGAGWLSSPGLAFGKNAPFLPNGAIYERMVFRQPTETPFGAADLFAAYKVKCAADNIGFGRSADRASRRQSRFLFYHIVVSMLRHIILLTPELQSPEVSTSSLTEAILRLASSESEGEFGKLCSAAVSLVDQYLTVGSERSVHEEKSFSEVHNGDMNAFLKAENLGKDDHSPLLVQALAIQNSAFDMSGGKNLVAQALLKT